MKRLIGCGLTAVTIFGSAGRLDLPFFWAYLGVCVIIAMGIRSVDPELLRERSHPGPGGTDMRLEQASGPFFLIHYVLAGLDVGRCHWSDSVPLQLQCVGLVGLAASLSLTLWAMRVNRYFSPVVRVQKERGHHLITDGPYRWVRHPGYLATACWIPASGLALGSWWSLAPLGVVLALALRRIVLEDRFLRRELQGYQEYAGNVRFRLVPHVW